MNVFFIWVLKSSYFLKLIKRLRVDFIEYSVDYIKCKILYFWTCLSQRIEIKYNYLESKIKNKTFYTLESFYIVLTFINGAIRFVISSNNNKYIKITHIF